jgi:hypothetical protein
MGAQAFYGCSLVIDNAVAILQGFEVGESGFVTTVDCLGYCGPVCFAII